MRLLSRIADDESGPSVALSGDGGTLTVGATGNDGTGSAAGHDRVFRFDAITAICTQMGEDLDGEASGDYLGYSGALSDDGGTLAVGALWNDATGSKAGHVPMFQLVAMTETWTQMGADVDGEASGDQSGVSVALSGDGGTLAVGAPYNYGIGFNAGHARVFQFDLTNTWTQMGADVDGEARDDSSGISVALSGDGGTLAVGARWNGGTGSYAGHVRVYQFDVITETWTQMGADVDGKASGDESGFSVALSGDGATLAVKGPGTGDAAGHVRVYRWANKL